MGWAGGGLGNIRFAEELPTQDRIGHLCAHQSSSELQSEGRKLTVSVDCTRRNDVSYPHLSSYPCPPLPCGLLIRSQLLIPVQGAPTRPWQLARSHWCFHLVMLKWCQSIPQHVCRVTTVCLKCGLTVRVDLSTGVWDYSFFWQVFRKMMSSFPKCDRTTKHHSELCTNWVSRQELCKISENGFRYFAGVCLPQETVRSQTCSQQQEHSWNIHVRAGVWAEPAGGRTWCWSAGFLLVLWRPPCGPKTWRFEVRLIWDSKLIEVVTVNGCWSLYVGPVISWGLSWDWLRPPVRITAKANGWMDSQMGLIWHFTEGLAGQVLENVWSNCLGH